MAIVDSELTTFIGKAVEEASAIRLANRAKREREIREAEERKKWVEEFLDKAERVLEKKGICHSLEREAQNNPSYRYDPRTEPWYETLPYPVLYGEMNLAVKLRGEKDKKVHSRPMIGRALIIALMDEEEFTLLTVDSYGSGIGNYNPISELQKRMAMGIVDALDNGLQVPTYKLIQYDSVQRLARV
ncbi:hypothetical protein HYZ06_00075 [Candidatus Daviesbacteria bacterium]|nr:hypothetical protein [Candidatus Daviesbacteria bacterium]